MTDCRFEWPSRERVLDHGCHLHADHHDDHECACGAKRSQLPDPPMVFRLLRHHDKSGVSGTGFVAEGIRFSDGAVAVRWTGDHPSTASWSSLDGVLAVHGHAGATEVVWVE